MRTQPAHSPGTGRRRLSGRGWRSGAGLIAVGLLATAMLVTSEPARAANTPSPDQVAALLGANRIRTEIVVLVDISGSMSTDGLYPQVKEELPLFMAALAKQNRHDTVVVIVFGTKQDTSQVYAGPPTGQAVLPAAAHSAHTDFGYAFQRALDTLSSPAPGVRAGGVLLLSDGRLDAAGDPRYNGYGARGWRHLRAVASTLGIPVTGFGLPLSTNQAVVNDVRKALKTVFAQQDTLAGGLGGLNRELDSAARGIEARRVARAAGPDIGRGIAVTWQDVPGAAGVPPLDLSRPGRARLHVTLRAATRRVHLRLHYLAVRLDGLPSGITARVRTPGRGLRPRQQVTVTVSLSWPALSGGASLTGGTQTGDGRLILSGKVTSPDTGAIRNSFGDTQFHVGALTGASSPELITVTQVRASVLLWVALLLLLAVLVVVGGVTGRRARLSGTLILTEAGGRPRALPLPRRWRVSRRTEGLIDVPGRITVRRNPRSRAFRVSLDLDKGLTAQQPLSPGGRVMAAGIDIQHQDGQPGSSGWAAPVSDTEMDRWANEQSR